MSNLYFTNKNDIMLILKSIMVDNNNLLPNILTSKKLTSQLNKFYKSIFEEIDHYKNQIDKIKKYNYKEKFYNYKISLEKFIDKINFILNNNVNICNFKVIKTNIIPKDLELQKITQIYEYNLNNQNVEIIFDIPSFNMFYNLSTCKLDLYFNNKNNNYCFNISPDLVNNFKVNKSIFNEFLNNFNLHMNKLKKKILLYHQEFISKLLIGNNMNIHDKE